VCILTEDGSTEPRHVAIKITYYNKGYIECVVYTVFVVTSILYLAKRGSCCMCTTNPNDLHNNASSVPLYAFGEMHGAIILLSDDA
jgi:hypothetical protein